MLVIKFLVCSWITQRSLPLLVGGELRDDRARPFVLAVSIEQTDSRRSCLTVFCSLTRTATKCKSHTDEYDDESPIASLHRLLRMYVRMYVCMCVCAYVCTMHVPFDTLVARVLFSIVGHRTWLRGKIVALFVFGFLKCDPVSVVYLRDLSDATPLFLPSTHLPYLSFGGYRASCKRLATFHRFSPN